MLRKILPTSFFLRPDVTSIAKDLLGKCLATNFDQQLTVMRIVETEAYNGTVDKASHAYNNRKTNRTRIMYEQGGIAYIYLCYGIHQMFNIVTNKAGIPHAILIRGGEPIIGKEIMASRTQKKISDTTLGKGPGNLCKALGIHTGYTGHPFQENEIFLYDDGYSFPKKDMGVSPRIGVAYSGEDAKLPYRFYIRHHPFVSGKWKK